MPINLAPQGRVSLEDYIGYGRQAVPDVFRAMVQQLEAETVKAFVSNLKEGPRQLEIRKKMEEAGWVMKNALRFMEEMASEINKKHPNARKRKRRALI